VPRKKIHIFDLKYNESFDVSEGYFIRSTHNLNFYLPTVKVVQCILTKIYNDLIAKGFNLHLIKDTEVTIEDSFYSVNNVFILNNRNGKYIINIVPIFFEENMIKEKFGTADAKGIFLIFIGLVYRGLMHQLGHIVDFKTNEDRRSKLAKIRYVGFRESKGKYLKLNGFSEEDVFAEDFRATYSDPDFYIIENQLGDLKKVTKGFKNLISLIAS